MHRVSMCSTPEKLPEQLEAMAFWLSMKGIINPMQLSGWPIGLIIRNN